MKALNIDQMLQKRREEVGSKDRFPTIAKATMKVIQRASWRISRKQYYDGPFS